MITITIGPIVDAGTSKIDLKGISTLRYLFLVTRAGLDTRKPGDIRIIPGMGPHPAVG